MDTSGAAAQLRIAAIGSWRPDRAHLATGRPHERPHDRDGPPQADPTLHAGRRDGDGQDLPAPSGTAVTQSGFGTAGWSGKAPMYWRSSLPCSAEGRQRSRTSWTSPAPAEPASSPGTTALGCAPIAVPPCALFPVLHRELRKRDHAYAHPLARRVLIAPDGARVDVAALAAEIAADT